MIISSSGSPDFPADQGATGTEKSDDLRSTSSVTFHTSLLEFWALMSTLELPDPKRRKLGHQGLVTSVSKIGTEIRSNGTITPVQVENVDDMDIDTSEVQCPCGHLHGLGEFFSHDISAVGFSSNLMRGPD